MRIMLAKTTERKRRKNMSEGILVAVSGFSAAQGKEL